MIKLGKLRKRFLIPLIVVLVAFGALRVKQECIDTQLPLSNVVKIKVLFKVFKMLFKKYFK